MKNKVKMNRQYVLLFWTLVTSILLTMSSYAWFSANRILGFRTFNLHVASKGGIHISTDAVEWKTVLALSDVINARSTYPNSLNQIPSSLEPVSTSGRVDDGLLRLFHGVADVNDSSSEFYLTATRVIEEEGFGDDSDGKFVAFDFFLKNHYEKTLFLTPESSIEHMTDRSTGIENAFRVAFLHLGTLPVDSNVRQIQNLRNSNRAIIWEPNYDVHTEFGVRNAREVYNIETSQTGAARIPYDGIISEINSRDNVLIRNANSRTHPNLFERVNVDIATRRNFTTLQEIVRLQPGISKIRVYIWIEGQDVDCEDNANVGEISIDLQMSVEQRQE